MIAIAVWNLSAAFRPFHYKVVERPRGSVDRLAPNPAIHRPEANPESRHSFTEAPLMAGSEMAAFGR